MTRPGSGSGPDDGRARRPASGWSGDGEDRPRGGGRHAATDEAGQGGRHAAGVPELPPPAGGSRPEPVGGRRRAPEPEPEPEPVGGGRRRAPEPVRPGGRRRAAEPVDGLADEPVYGGGGGRRRAPEPEPRVDGFSPDEPDQPAGGRRRAPEPVNGFHLDGPVPQPFTVPTPPARANGFHLDGPVRPAVPKRPGRANGFDADEPVRPASAAPELPARANGFHPVEPVRRAPVEPPTRVNGVGAAPPAAYRSPGRTAPPPARLAGWAARAPLRPTYPPIVPTPPREDPVLPPPVTGWRPSPGALLPPPPRVDGFHADEPARPAARPARAEPEPPARLNGLRVDEPVRPTYRPPLVGPAPPARVNGVHLDEPVRSPVAAPADPPDSESTQLLHRYVPAAEMLEREDREPPTRRPPTLPEHPPRAVVRRRRARRRLLEWPFLIVFALLSAYLIRSYVVQTFYIPSGSMHQTLLEGDRVLVNKVSFHLHDPDRGDVVVFRRPPDFPVQDEDLIKRVVALPGETVEARGSQIYVDGRPLTEPYVEPLCRGTQDFPQVTVPAGHLWVMGDNRCNSSDSRVFGPIDDDLLVGRAFVLAWPFHRLTWL